jgi:hypothetical protein
MSGSGGAAYLVGKLEEVCRNRAAAASCQDGIRAEEGMAHGGGHQVSAGLGHSRLVLCGAQALQELEAIGRRRLGRLRVSTVALHSKLSC